MPESSACGSGEPGGRAAARGFARDSEVGVDSAASIADAGVDAPASDVGSDGVACNGPNPANVTCLTSKNQCVPSACVGEQVCPDEPALYLTRSELWPLHVPRLHVLRKFSPRWLLGMRRLIVTSVPRWQREVQLTCHASIGPSVAGDVSG